MRRQTMPGSLLLLVVEGGVWFRSAEWCTLGHVVGLRVVSYDNHQHHTRKKAMPKYLLQGNYTEQGLKGLLKEGGSKRREAVEQLAKAAGGKLEVFYYAFGGDDFFIIVDVPSSVDAAAVAMTVNASGAAKLKTTVLIAPEEVDQATKKTVKYRPPGL